MKQNLISNRGKHKTTMINFQEKTAFELAVMDLMENHKNEMTTANDIECYSDELHQSIETAIMDMLTDGFNNINPDDYNEQY